MESDDEETVRKITEFINKQKRSNQQVDYAEFLTNEESESDNSIDSEVENLTIINDEDSTSNSFLETQTPSPTIETVSEEDQATINACTDPQLKELLLFNRKRATHLSEALTEIENLSYQVDLALESIISAETANVPSQFVWKLAAPYFKDSNMYKSPPNEDVRRKTAANELSIVECCAGYLRHKWTRLENDRLINAVRTNYKLTREADVKIRLSRVRNEDDKQKIANLERELEEVRSDDKLPPLNSNEFVNWTKISSLYFDEKRSDAECKSMWHCLLHPAINHAQWSESENKHLVQLQSKYKNQNWDKIAAELGTNRTAFQACVQYVNKQSPRQKQKFTQAEDELLIRLVNRAKVNLALQWDEIAPHFAGRSRSSLYHRYHYFLDEERRPRKVGKFSESEDILLLILVHKYGQHFSRCVEHMPHRTGMQLKSRYVTNLKRDIKKGSFDLRDDRLILRHVAENGAKDWSALRNQCNRSSPQLRQRYTIIAKFLDKNPTLTIDKMPRKRRFVDKTSSDVFSFRHFIADRYKESDYIPTLKEIEDSLLMSMPEFLAENRNRKRKTTVDTMLVDFFASSAKMKNTTWMNEQSLVEAVGNLQTILQTLDVRLHLPEDLEADSNLDAFDVQILARLPTVKREPQLGVSGVLAPSLNSLVALRSLIIKHRKYKERMQDGAIEYLMYKMEAELAELGEAERGEVVRHRELFQERFDAVFDWSAVLSLVRPYFGELGESSRLENVEPPSKRQKTNEDVMEIVSNVDVELKEDMEDLEKLNQFLSKVNKSEIL